MWDNKLDALVTPGAAAAPLLAIDMDISPMGEPLDDGIVLLFLSSPWFFLLLFRSLLLTCFFFFLSN
jgi:hypothetical protein